MSPEDTKRLQREADIARAKNRGPDRVAEDIAKVKAAYAQRTQAQAETNARFREGAAEMNRLIQSGAYSAAMKEMQRRESEGRRKGQREAMNETQSESQ